MYRSPEHIQEEISKLSKKLRKIAEADNQITNEEQVLLDLIDSKLKNMQEQLIQILASELDDEEFSDILNDILDDILHNVEKTALVDGIITEDEKHIIDAIHSFVERKGRVHE